MLTLIGKRLLFAIPSLIGVVIVTFLLTRALPGDPAAYFAGPAATKEAVDQIRKKLGFDKPLIEQFVRYTNDLAHGDLGSSLTTGQPVAAELRNRLPASAELTLLGLVVSIVIAIPLGMLAATRPGSWIDHLCRVTTTAGVSLPVFFTGLVLVYLFYFRLGWSPAPLGRLDVFYSAPPTVTGFYLVDTLIARDFEAFRSALSQLILPAVTLAIFSLAPIARMTRASMLAVLASDFVRTARASGLSPGKVIVTYAFRNAMLPVITTLSMGVLVPARGQCAGGKGVRLARHRLLRGRGADRVRLRAGAGLRADHGGHVRSAQSDDRHPLRRDRSPRQAGGLNMIRKSAKRFSEKIMLKQGAEAR
ncbi:ABC-type dipeptide/oligopeptide/nickel transport system permease component [Bradyrhizobium elkanii]